MLFNQIRITAPRNRDAWDQPWSPRKKGFQEAAHQGPESGSPGGGGAELSTPLLSLKRLWEGTSKGPRHLASGQITKLGVSGLHSEI